MKLSEFESHPLWGRLDDVESWLDLIRGQDDGRNIDYLDELRTRAGQLRAAHKTRRRLASLIVPPQLSAVDAQYQHVWNSVHSAVDSDAAARTQYLVQAISHAQAATEQQGTWPSPTPTQTEERLEVAVVDELLARDRESEDIARARIETINQRLHEAEEQGASIATQVGQAEKLLAKLVDQAVSAVNAEKARIATVIDEGQSAISGFEKTLRDHLRDWQKELTESFNEETESLRTQEHTLLVQSEAQYEALTRTIADYESLVQADSADRLAKHYEDEASRAARAGWLLTIFGFITLLAAAVPLVLVLLTPSAEPSWQSLASRAGISAVLVGAATVMVRMGSGFQRRATEYKRLAMELRTMGPFLAAVADTESVDQARLDLVNRTFGQNYADPKDDRPDDSVPVTVIQQLLTLLTKTVSR